MTAGERRALIIATGKYRDTKFKRLRSPAVDAERLSAALENPEIGDFLVEAAVDEDEANLRRRIARFFRRADPNDVLLLHLSCHGVKDERGVLYLTATDSELGLLEATAIAAPWLDAQMANSRCRQILLMLDCCFSGKFPFNASAKAGTAIDVQEPFHGQGRAVITASNAMEYAYEGEVLAADDPQPSHFTAAVVEALETGAADRDGDDWISLDELYDYVFHRVRERSPGQTPNRQVALEGVFYVARCSSQRPVEPAKLDDNLLTKTEDLWQPTRLAAVKVLAGFLSKDDPRQALAAELVLQRLAANDDSSEVRETARAAVEEAQDLARRREETRRQRSEELRRQRQQREADDRTRREAEELARRDIDDYRRQKSEDRARQEAKEAARRDADQPLEEADIQVRREEHDSARQEVDEGEERQADEPARPSTSTKPARRRDVQHVITVEHPKHGPLGRGPRGIKSIAMSPDGQRIATASQDKTARIWNVSSGREVAQIVHDDIVFGVAFSPDGRSVATASQDRTARVHDVERGHELARVDCASVVFNVAFSPDGECLATASSGERAMRIWEIETGREIMSFTLSRAGARGVAYSADGHYIVAADRGGTAYVWETATGREVTRVSPHGEVRAVAFSPDGQCIAAASEYGGAIVWQIELGGELARVGGRALWDVAFSPDGTSLATASEDCTARLWDIATAHEWYCLRHKDYVRGVAFSPDGDHIVTACDDGSAHVWRFGIAS